MPQFIKVLARVSFLLIITLIGFSANSYQFLDPETDPIVVDPPKSADRQVVINLGTKINEATRLAPNIDAILDLSLTVVDFQNNIYTSTINSGGVVNSSTYSAVFDFPKSNWTSATHSGTALKYTLTLFETTTSGVQQGPVTVTGVTQFE